MCHLSLLFVLLTLGADADHAGQNPLYAKLVSGETPFTLPKPTLPDGLDAAQALATIEKIPARHIPVDQFLRKSVVAPMIIDFRDVDTAKAELPVHGLDVWFVAYGDFDLLSDRKFLDELLDWGGEDAEVHDLTNEQLARVGIQPPGDEKRQHWAHSVFGVIDRVQLAVTTETYVSQTDESVIFAAQVDPRFANDPELANRWRSLTRTADGQWKVGPPHPYEGADCYLKVTRLLQPAGAMLIEFHLAFNEPHGWFGGANLLRSKLPILIQSQVRTFRRKLSKRTASQ